MTEDISAGRILGRTLMLLSRNAVRVVPLLLVLTALSVLVDTDMVDQANASALNLLQSVITVAASYLITKALVEQIAERSLPGRFPAFFGLGILTTLGILLGLVVLVIPGLVLAVRWSASDPILLGSDDSVTEAMQHSWRATGPHFWPILVALLGVYGPSWGLAASVYVLEGIGYSGTPAIVLADLALETGVIAGWHLAVAIYALLEGPDRLAETFA